MKGFVHHPAARAAGRCCGCEWFADDDAAFEAALPGLTIMGSAAASVRGDDGLCDLHGRLVSARATCPRFAPRGQTVATEA